MGIGIGYNSAVNFSDLIGQISLGQIPDNLITPAKLATTGTPDNTTFLRGDGEWSTPSGGSASLHIVNARFTLTSGTPILSSTVSSAGTGYITPYKGNKIRLYNGSSWGYYTLSEISIDFSALSANTLYDVFLYASGSSILAETVAWSSATARSVALGLQDGVKVKSTDSTRLYFATFYLDASKQCHFHTGYRSTASGTAKVYFQNYYNQIEHSVQLYIPSDYWTYGTATWRQANADSNFKAEFVIGSVNSVVSAFYNSCPNASTTSIHARLGIGIDRTNNFDGFNSLNTNLNTFNQAAYSGYVSEGLHYAAGVEYSSGATSGFTGNNNGLGLKIKC